ncbi:hypothetical protein EYR40_009994 [Pleurotus pulmonarius]|nr:hypothetical protein EYR36_010612 [Pleurotus pulmonarius]KAF4588443.1 hypothetical protein EYR40_009994 [Pleurotus pulmonarius]KAF4590519.1 hypothetical protein EYR38_009820 [Pleurotus pulmonarius]
MQSSTLKDIIVVLVVSGVTTLNVFLSGALTVALPTIGKDLNFRQADLQWPVNVFALSYGCLLLFFGRVGDIVGGRIMFMVGSAWFAAWSIATAFAPNDKAFIIFIALKGLGAAANTPSGIGLLSSYFPPGPKRNKAFGALGAGQPLGFIGGLILGGILTDSRATWRAIFFIQAGLGFLFVALGWLVLPKTQIEHRYTKGLDWGGAILSTAGIGLLTYSLADSTTASKGWATPHIPSLLSASAVILGGFIFYERWREARDKSVLMPLSMWRQPGAKMGSVIVVVFFAWWSFNTLSYFATLYYQQVNYLNPIQTSLRFIPMALAGFSVNLITGYVVNRLPGQGLILAGLVGSVVAPIIFSTINVDASYWASAFLVMIFIVGADAVYPVGNLQIISHFNEDSQSLAGGIFNVATRLGTSLGLAITSSIATSTSERYNKVHPEFAADSPEVLMVGFRAAGWTCLAAAALGFIVAAIGLRGIGVVGRITKNDDSHGDLSLESIKSNSQVSVRTIKTAGIESCRTAPDSSLTIDTTWRNQSDV